MELKRYYYLKVKNKEIEIPVEIENPVLWNGRKMHTCMN